MVLGFDRQSWITVFAALLLALITLFTNDAHFDRGEGHRPVSWHPTIDVDVERYAIEQRL